MKAYVISNYTISDETTYASYPPNAARTVAKYGGKTIVVSHNPCALEGTPHSVIVVVEFGSLQQAHDWYTSQEYQSIKHYRTEVSEGWVIIVPEFNFSTMFSRDPKVTHESAFRGGSV